MNKTVKKLIPLTLAAATVLSSAAGLAGCQELPEDISIDETKAQLYIQNYNGGFGTDWLDDTVAEFMELKKDTVYRPNTKGVQITVQPTKTMSYAENDPWQINFADTIKSYGYYDSAVEGKYFDLTYIVNAENPYDNNKKLADKLYDTQKEFLTANPNQNCNGKYFALPHYERTTSFIYDIDLFEDYNLYFAKNRTSSDFISTFNPTKSNGPDGKAGTEDDGLPATILEYETLFRAMKDRSVAPLIYWGRGNAGSYVKHLIKNVALNLAGPEKAQVYYSLNGKADIVTDYDKLAAGDYAGAVTEMDITPEKGYLMSRSIYTYYALELLQLMVRDEDRNFDTDAFSDTFSHTDVQREYIYSSLRNEPIAMLVESNYWLNEAKDAVATSITEFGTDAENRHYGYMPLPYFYSDPSGDNELTELEVNDLDGDGTIEEGEGRQQTVLQLQDAYVWVDAKKVADEYDKELIKDFLLYCYSDQELVDFTRSTNTIKPIKYPYEAALDSFNPFTKEVYFVRKSAALVNPWSSEEFAVQTSGGYNFNWTTSVGVEELSEPVEALWHRKRTEDGATHGIITAFEYFKGIPSVQTEQAWNTLYSEFLPTAE